MAIWYKIGGVWTQIDKPYVKINGIQRVARNGYVKRSGIYTRAYEYDVTPSASPLLSLQIIKNSYIRVGARLPGSHDPDLKRIRILVSRTEMPKTQFGNGFEANEDREYRREPWSDWYYNGQNPNGDGHGADTTDWDYKDWPVNANDDTNLKGDKYYYFAAWSEDRNGNWSPGTFTRVFMPKNTVKAPRVLYKEAVFRADESGSGGLNGAGFTGGDLTQRETPRSNGYWTHGNQIVSAIPSNATIKSAQIRISRINDTGLATANVNLFWHEKGTTDDFPVPDAGRNGITTVGTINKGEAKWFDIPESYYTALKNSVKGFGLAYGIQASDFMTAAGLETDLRCGEVNIVWEEAL